MTIRPSQFCVYKHIADGVAFYVGSGRSHRPFVSAGRNGLWHETVGVAGYFEVDIIGWFATQAEALAVERSLIDELRPTANIVHSQPIHKPKERKYLLVESWRLSARGRPPLIMACPFDCGAVGPKTIMATHHMLICPKAPGNGKKQK